MNRRTRLFLSALLLPAVLVGLPIWLTRRAIRQERLDRALITAVKQRNADTVAALLKQGADPNTSERNATSSAFPQLFLNMIPAYRRQNGPIRMEQPVLEVALYPYGEGHARPYNHRLVKALLEAGANPCCRDDFDETPLHIATLYVPSEVPYLLEKGADVNARNRIRETPLFGVITPLPARLLLADGADVNAKNREGMSVLSHFLLRMAAVTGAPPNLITQSFPPDKDANALLMVGLYLERGADVNAGDAYGVTPLIHAAMYGNADVVAALLKHHAAVNAKDKSGDTAYRIARSSGHWKVAALLKQAGAKE